MIGVKTTGWQGVPANRGVGAGVYSRLVTRATGIGSWPGTNVREAVVTVRDLLGDGHLPHLPELPARGPGADMVGRATALLVDLSAELTPSGWRLADRPGRDRSRATGYLREDLDELAEAYDGWTGELKVQVTGPWTLAAHVELPRGERVLTDPGAVRDLAGSLAEGVRGHVAEVERLVPGARLVVQLDEPALPAVLDGRLPTASGYGRVRPVDREVVGRGLADAVAAAGPRPVVVHCCDPTAPLGLIAGSGAAAVSGDTTRLTPAGWDAVAEVVEGGTGLWAGCLPTDRSGGRRTAVETLLGGWRRTGLAGRDLARVTVTPACGLAGLTPGGARSVLRTAVEVAAALTDETEAG